MQRLCLFVLLLLLPDAAMARCAPFDFFQSLGKIPFVVHGRVIQSNKDSLLSAQCNAVPCRHTFSADVVEVVKGRTAATRLEFQYDYVGQRPEIAVFAPGEDFVFALSRIGAGGQATLVGTTCGRPGLEIRYLDQVKRALQQRR
jgi:hypothetical protein